MNHPVSGLVGSIDPLGTGDAVNADLVRVTGWALDEKGPAQHVQVLVDGEAVGRVRRGTYRPDIEQAYPAVPGAVVAGWEAPVDLRGTRRSEVVVRLLAHAGGQRWHELANDRAPLASRPREGRHARAAYTIVQNEAGFLPAWIAHYSRFFEPGDIYVLDHDSTDGSTRAVAGCCQVIPVHRAASFDHTWLRSTVEQFQTFLLASYETVLFAEVDEFVVAEPQRYAGLGDYIDRMQDPVTCCTGYNVVHYPFELPLKLQEPILRQRSYWHRSQEYSKRLIAKTPLSWSPGFHVELQYPEVAPDPDLYLIHLHRADYASCLARHRASAARPWNQDDVRNRQGFQNRIVEAGEFRHWFFNVDLGSSTPERIPEHLKPLL